MKEIKEFIQELYDSATSGYTGMLVPLDAATRIVSEAFAAAEFTYRGHSYIWFHHPGGWDGNDGIVHNPDCECNKK